MTKIHTETFGSGKPITLVHGWAMHSGIWRSFANALAKHCQVTLLDLPGHGFSENISPFTLESISQSLVDAVEEENSCWLGWSLGAACVLEIAHRYPGRVNKLVLLAGTPCFVKKSDWPGMSEQVLENFAASLQQDSQGTLLRFLALQIKGLDDQKSALQKVIPFVSESPAPNQQILQEGLAILKETDLRDEFAELKIPVTVILGQLDTLIPAAVGEKMQALLPGMDLKIINRAGHMPFLSHEDAVVKAVCDFMDQQ
jgi:pimeloyl-[acyl-carrier protein] methyl ester esterase